MHVRAQLLQPLLVRDAEVLLLVDDQQAQIAELDRLGQQRVGADHDVDLSPFVEPSCTWLSLLRGHEARGLRDLDREARGSAR